MSFGAAPAVRDRTSSRAATRNSTLFMRSPFGIDLPSSLNPPWGEVKRKPRHSSPTNSSSSTIRKPSSRAFASLLPGFSPLNRWVVFDGDRGAHPAAPLLHFLHGQFARLEAARSCRSRTRPGREKDRRPGPRPPPPRMDSPALRSARMRRRTSGRASSRSRISAVRSPMPWMASSGAGSPASARASSESMSRKPASARSSTTFGPQVGDAQRRPAPGGTAGPCSGRCLPGSSPPSSPRSRGAPTERAGSKRYRSCTSRTSLFSSRTIEGFGPHVLRCPSGRGPRKSAGAPGPGPGSPGWGRSGGRPASPGRRRRRGRRRAFSRWCCPARSSPAPAPPPGSRPRAWRWPPGRRRPAPEPPRSPGCAGWRWRSWSRRSSPAGRGPPG